jgi:ribonuclease HII
MKSILIGADEAGRGAWAGPLVAVAVCLKTGQKFNHKLLRDSKKLSPKQREEVFAYLQEVVEIGVGIVSPGEIDEMGLQRANVVAVERAIKKLRIKKEELRDMELKIDYIGAFKKYTTLKENYSLHKFGESKFLEIAAASIIAKVTRDRMMMELAKEFTHYGFELHKGYGTKLHQEQLKRYGVTRIHRRSFGPIELIQK